jgi:hypothetical protein
MINGHHHVPRYGQLVVRLDSETDTIWIEGIAYSMNLFREFGGIADTGKTLRITKDDEGRLNVYALKSGDIVP